MTKKGFISKEFSQALISNGVAALISNGVAPAVIARILDSILNTETYSFIERMTEAGAALQRQACQEGEPDKWKDFLEDIGNIARILYDAQHNSEAINALISIMEEAARCGLQQLAQTTTDK